MSASVQWAVRAVCAPVCHRVGYPDPVLTAGCAARGSGEAEGASYGSSSSQPDEASDSGGAEEEELLMGPMDIDDAGRAPGLGQGAAPGGAPLRRRAADGSAGDLTEIAEILLNLQARHAGGAAWGPACRGRLAGPAGSWQQSGACL
jgi:hypothetical protein